MTMLYLTTGKMGETYDYIHIQFSRMFGNLIIH